MKRLLFSVLLLPFSLLGADPIPFMLATNGAIHGGQTNFFDINAALMTNALAAVGYSPGGGSGSVASTDITDSTVAGRALLTAANAAAQLTALGTAALYEPLNSNKYQATNGNLTTIGTLDGAALTNLNGSSIASGTVAAARLDFAMATDVEVAAAITANTNFPALNVGTMVVTNFSVGTTNVPAELALKANSLNPTTTGTLTHGGTNAIITSSNATFNVGKANALVIGTNGNVGVGKVPASTRGLDVVGDTVVTGTIQATSALFSSSTPDAASGYGAASVSSSGGGFFTKAVSASQYLIRSNAPSTAAARGANTLVQEFNTNQFRVIATGPTTNEMVLATINTSGILAVNGLQFNQSELQPFSAVTNYVADFDGPTQQTILVTNLIANFLHATNVAAGKMRSFIIRAGTNATVTVVLPRPLWECNTNVATLAANQSLTLSLTGFGPDSNTNVNATVGPIYSR